MAPAGLVSNCYRCSYPQKCATLRLEKPVVARIPVPGLLSVRHNWLIGDKAGANVLHYSFAPATVSNDAFVTEVAGTTATEMADLVLLWGADTTYLGTTVTDLSSSTAPSSDIAGTAVGTRTGEPIPANVAVLQQYGVARRYRGGHPRTYWPWFTASDIDTPQTWLTDSVTDAHTASALALASGVGVTSGGFTTVSQVQVSYYLAGVLRLVPVVDVITQGDIAPEIASQRRRDGRH